MRPALETQTRACVATLLTRIVSEGRFEATDQVVEPPGYVYALPGKEVCLTQEASDQLDEIATEFWRIAVLNETRKSDEVIDLVLETVATVALDFDDQSFDADSLVSDLFDRLLVGYSDWHTWAVVHGVNMADGERLEIGGFVLGRLSTAEREEHLARANRIGRTVFFVDNSELGSEHAPVTESNREYLDGTDCWARTVVYCRESDVDRVIEKRIQDVVFNVLRFCALEIGYSPDQLSLGESDSGLSKTVLYYKVDEKGEGNRVHRTRRRLHGRRPLRLFHNQIRYLEQSVTFQAVQRVATTYTDDPSSLTNMQRRLLFSLMQFGTAASIERPEIKLSTYLTVLEGLFSGEQGRHSDPHGDAADRLSLCLPDGERSHFCEHVDHLYDLRWEPMHRAERNLRDIQVVDESDVFWARDLARRAILYALERGQADTDHGTFIKRLDAELGKVPSAEGGTKRQYAFIATVDDSNYTTITVPDFPGFVGRGSTWKAAKRAALNSVRTEIQKRRSEGEPIPEPTAKAGQLEFTVESTATQ